MHKDNIMKKLPLFICAIILTALISGSYLEVIYLDANLIGLLLFAAVGVLVSAAMLYNKYTIFISIGVVLLHVLFSFVDVIFFSDIAEFINQVAEQMYYKIFWADTEIFISETAAILFVSFLVGFSLYLIFAKIKNTALAVIGVMVYVLSLQVFFYDYIEETSIYINSFVGMITILVLAIYRRYDKIKVKQSNIWLKYMSPVICIILSFTLILSAVIETKANEDFLDWVQQILNKGNIDIAMPDLVMSEFMDLDGTLKGEAKFNNSYFSVNVTAEEGKPELQSGSIYLRAFVGDTYIKERGGNKWLSNINEYESQVALSNYFAMGNAYFAFDGDYYEIGEHVNNQNYQMQKCVVEGAKFTNNQIFSHLMTTQVDAEAYINYDKSSTLYSDRDIDSYAIYYKNLFKRDLLDTEGGNSFKYYEDVMDPAVYNNIKQYYLQVHEDISDEVKSMALDVTKNELSDYRKALAIEQYLKTSYTYDLKAGDQPRGDDFVNYFLLENKKGFCTHFASAMVIMCRSLEIPARIVCGYRVDGVENGVRTMVSSSRAHAWVEVFMPDFGWITFDPVGGSDFAQNDPGSITFRPQTPASQEPVTPTPEDSQEPITPTPEESTEPSEVTTEPVTPGATDEPLPDDSGNGGNIILYIILGFTSAALIAIAYILAKKRMVNIRNIKRTPARLFNELVCIKSYENERYNWEYGETIAAYFEKINSNSDLSYNKMFDIFDQCFYNDKDLSEDEYLYISQIIKDTEDVIVGNKGKSKIKWKRYVKKFFR